MNCRGLGGGKKRLDVLNFVKQKKYAIACLQDIHIDSDQENMVRAEWGAEVVISTYRSNARGVGIFISKGIEYKMHKSKVDKEGNFVILDITVEGKRLTLVSIYGPNTDKPSFYKQIVDAVRLFGNSSIIYCGDWNFVMDSDLDLDNYKHVNNPNSRKLILDYKNDHGLVDVWRVEHESVRQYTWRQRHPRKQARLDFFLVSEDLASINTSSKIVPGYKSDHSGIVISLKLNPQERGPGYWKLNASYLHDKNYVQHVKDIIHETITMYAAAPYNRETLPDISRDSLQLTIPDQLFLEVLLMSIRGMSIQFGSRKKRKNQEAENKLQATVERLETEVHTDFAGASETSLRELAQAKQKLSKN